MNENILEDATFDWLADMGYECLLGDDISPGGSDEDREHYSDVVLTSRVQSALQRLNPDASAQQLDEAFTHLSGYASQSLVDGNKELYDWLRNGVPVESIESDGTRGTIRLRVLDFEGKNDLAAARQFTIKGNKPRRPDVIVFINGLPLIVIELKKPDDLNADIESAFNQIQNYKADIPQLFYFNLLNIISDGVVARYGSLTANFGRFTPWRLLNGEKQAVNPQMELEVLIRGLLTPQTLMSFFKGFVAFGGESGAETYKIIAQWHQYHGVLKAAERASDALLHKKDGKGGVVWFTQGSGKSLLALFYVMYLRDLPEFKNPTIVLVTDRNDLDGSCTILLL